MTDESGRSSVNEIDCPRCGKYEITSMVSSVICNSIKDDHDRDNLSSYIRENQGIQIDSRNIDSLIPKTRPSVSERGEKLLRYLARDNPTPGIFINIPFKTLLALRVYIEERDAISYNYELFEKCKMALPLMAAAWTSKIEEFRFLLNDVLSRSQGYLEENSSVSNFKSRITAKGWDFLDKGDPNVESVDAFVAMSFGEELVSMYDEIILRAVEGSGYRPVRIDREQHVNRIDDEIIARIRRARFVVADFTEHKHGVYFEAGFALGLGIPVIWMCRKEEMEGTHFDTRQYNTIVWNDDERDEARKRLQNRIEAVIGRGNYVRKPVEREVGLGE